MKLPGIFFLLACPLLLFAASSPEQVGDIKSLSQDEIAGYLDGKGMGLAKAAELNGYPGPRHVLDLADELVLSPEQRKATKEIFDAMQARARELGHELVREERGLDQEFSTRKITAERLAEFTNRIGALNAAIRKAHLEAHLQESAILTAEQNSKYQHLRGHGDADAQEHHGARPQ